MKHLVLAAALIFISAPVLADHDIKTAIDMGTYIDTAFVAGSSVTGTAFSSVGPKKMDGLYFNNTASTIWIGTTTATAQTAHENVRIGFPVLSSSTFRLGGVMSAALAFTCNPGVAACEIRSAEGLNR